MLKFSKFRIIWKYSVRKKHKRAYGNEGGGATQLMSRRNSRHPSWNTLNWRL